MNNPSTLREAIANQILGEVDGLVRQVESLKSDIISLSQEMTASTKTLDDAGDRFRMTVTSFSEQAKTELSEHLDRATHIVLTQKANEIHAAMSQAAKTAFEAQSWDTAGTLAKRLHGAANEFRRGLWTRMFENSIVALLAGLLASALTYGFTRQ